MVIATGNSSIFTSQTLVYSVPGCVGTPVSSSSSNITIGKCTPPSATYLEYGVVRVNSGLSQMIIGVYFGSTPPSFTNSYQGFLTANGIRRFYYRSSGECSNEGPISFVTNFGVNYCIPATTPFFPTTPQQQMYYLIQSCTNTTQTATIYLNSNCQTQFSQSTTLFSDMGLDSNNCGRTLTGSTYCTVNATTTSTICPLVSPFYINICTAPNASPIPVPTPVPTPASEEQMINVSSNDLSRVIIGLVVISLSLLIMNASFLYFVNSKVDRITNMIITKNNIDARARTTISAETSNPISHRI